MAVKEQLDDVSKSLKGILDQMKGIGEAHKKIETSTKTYKSNVDEAHKALEKVLKTLRDISAEQDKISKSSSGMKSMVSVDGGSLGSRTSANPASFSSVVKGSDGASLVNAGRPSTTAAPQISTIAGMPATAFATSFIGTPFGMKLPSFTGLPIAGMDTALGAAMSYGVTSGNGGATGGGMPTKPSKWATAARALAGFGKFALGTGAIGAGLAYNATPSVEDVMAYKGSIMPVALFSNGGGYDRRTAERRMRANFGQFQSSENSINMSGSMLTMGGFNGRRFDQVQQEAATSFMVSGMDNAAATQGLMGLRSPQTTSSLMSSGIFVSNLSTGDDLGINSVVDQIWNRSFRGRKDITYTDVQNSIRGGYLGAGLRKQFGDNPALYQMIVERLLLKAKMNGTTLADKNEKWMQDAYAKMGVNKNNAPNVLSGELSTSRNKAIGSVNDSMTPGIVAGIGNVVGLNNSVSDLAENNSVFQAFLGGKGAVQAFSGTTEGAAVNNALAQEIALLTGLFGNLAEGLVNLMVSLGISVGSAAAGYAASKWNQARGKTSAKGNSRSQNPREAERTASSEEESRLRQERATTRAERASAAERPLSAAPITDPERGRVGTPSGRFVPTDTGLLVPEDNRAPRTSTPRWATQMNPNPAGRQAFEAPGSRGGAGIGAGIGALVAPTVQQAIENVTADALGIPRSMLDREKTIVNGPGNLYLRGPNGRETASVKITPDMSPEQQREALDLWWRSKYGGPPPPGTYERYDRIYQTNMTGNNPQPSATTIRRAPGGPVAGVGTSTSDSIPAWLSHGEFVVNAKAVQTVGRSTLERINSLGHDLGSAFASPARLLSTGGPADGQGIVDYANQFVGQVPYVDSAKTKARGRQPNPENGWDCSTFTQYVLQKFGARNAPGLSTSYLSYGTEVPIGSQQPGDILVFDTEGGAPGPAGHVAIYAGNGEIIHAQNSRTGTTRMKMSQYYLDRLVSVRRVSGNTNTVPAGVTNGSSRSDGDGDKSALLPILLSTATAGSSALYGLMGSSGIAAAPLLSQSLLSGDKSMPWTDSAYRTMTRSTPADAPSSVPMGKAQKGPVWLAKFLYNKGVRGDTLKTLWALGMRESSGRPTVDNAGTNSNGSVDYGLWQINDIHEPWLQKTFGWSMEDMRDPDKNFRAMWRMTQHGQNLRNWNLGPDGYDKANQGKHTAAYEKYANQFDKYASQAGLPGYMAGLVRVNGDQNVRVHDGEMILPPLPAEEFRRVLQESLTSSKGRGDGPITINLRIDKASDEEAMRFARKVKALIEDDQRMHRVRSR